MLLLSRYCLVLLYVLAVPAAAFASEDGSIWDASISRGWLDDHVAAAQHASRSGSTYRLNRTQVWTGGIAASGMQAFAPHEFDRAVGAKLQPFQSLNLMLGTELTRSGGDNRFLSSRTSWEAFWSHAGQKAGGLRLGFATAGSLINNQAGYSQSLTGTLDVPLDLLTEIWSTELRLSPNMSIDAMDGVVSSGLVSEIRSRKVLSSRADPYRSVLNLSLGYGLAPDTRPTASAKLELRITPNL
jgi:hypothetical protein